MPRRPAAPARLAPACALLVLPLALLFVSDGAPARAEERPGLAELALLWAQGDYRAPLVCEIEGTAHRALRRIRIAPGPRAIGAPTDRMIFYDLEAPPDTRCVAPTGGEEPNVVGQLLLGFEGPARPDIADRDFRTALRREGGFTFPIKTGRVKVGPPDGELVEHDLAGGTVRVTLARPGTDGFRRLADFAGRRKLRLEIEGPEGLRLAFDLFQPGS